MSDKTIKEKKVNYQKNLMIDNRFLPTFLVQFLGAFNDNVFKNALIILITFKAFSIGMVGTEQMVAICGGIFILPFFLFSAYAGQLADKFSKNKLIFWIKIWEISVMLFGATGFLSENIYLLLVTLFFMGLQSTFFGPVKYSILPELINKDELLQGNALIEMGTFLSILLGTIIGGLLIAMPDFGAIYISVTVIILAIVGTLFSLKISDLSPCDPKLKINKGIFIPTLKIIKIAKEVKGIWNSILGISWFWFFGAAILSIFPIYVKDIIGGDAKVVTLFLALFSIGVAFGSIICEKLSKERLELGLVPIGSIGMTLFILDLYFLDIPTINTQAELQTVWMFLRGPSSWRIVIDLFMLSVFSGLFIVPLYTFIQQRSDRSVTSRIIAANNIMNAIFMVCASLFLTFLYSIGVKATDLFLILGISNALVAIYIYTIIPEFILRFIIMIITRMIYKVETNGLNNVPDEGPCVIVSNHISYIDWMIIASSIKRPVRFVMSYQFFNIPLLKFFFKGAKVIPISGHKENPHILQRAMEQISNELNDGEVICIFPEGKITTDGELDTFKTGVEKIIAKNPVLTIPIALKGLWGSYFSLKHGKVASKPLIIFKTIWSKITVDISSPVLPQEVTALGLEEKIQKMLK